MTDVKPEATRWRRSVTLDFISSGDGQAHTILLSENLQARNWNRAKAIHDFAFGVPVSRDRDLDDSVEACLNPRPAYEWILREYGAMPRMNQEAKPGTAPRPSSNHLGICIYGFADGSAKQISDSIDWQVYLRLLTPNGQRYGQSAPTTGCDSY